MAGIEDTIFAKMQKLYNLWERNTEGAEAEAAQAKKILDNMLSKYNMTLEDLIKPKDEVQEFYFRYSSEEEKKLLIQSVVALFGTLSDEWKNFYRRNNGKMVLYIKTTKAKYVLLEDLWLFHVKNWNLQKKIMLQNAFHGYLSSNELFDKDEDKNPNKKSSRKANELLDWALIMNFKAGFDKGAHYTKKVGKDALKLENK